MAKPFVFRLWKDVKAYEWICIFCKNFVPKSMSANKVKPLNNKILEVMETLEKFLKLFLKHSIEVPSGTLYVREHYIIVCVLQHLADGRDHTLSHAQSLLAAVTSVLAMACT